MMKHKAAIFIFWLYIGNIYPIEQKYTTDFTE